MGKCFFRSHRSHRPAGPAKITVPRKALPLSLELLESRLAPAATAPEQPAARLRGQRGPDEFAGAVSFARQWLYVVSDADASGAGIGPAAPTRRPTCRRPIRATPVTSLSPPSGGASGSPSASVVRMQLLASPIPRPQLLGLNQLSSTSNYLVSGFPPNGLTATSPTMAASNTRTSIRALTWSFTAATPPPFSTTSPLAAGVDPNLIQLNFDGADQVSLDSLAATWSCKSGTVRR